MNVIEIPNAADLPLYAGVPMEKIKPGFRFHYATGNWEVRSVNPPQICEVTEDQVAISADNLQSDPTPNSLALDVMVSPNPEPGCAPTDAYMPPAHQIVGPMKETPKGLKRLVDPKHWVFPEELRVVHVPGLMSNPPVVEGEPTGRSAFSSTEMDQAARKVWSMLGIVAQAKRR
jgi:hypothetical protein